MECPTLLLALLINKMAPVLQVNYTQDRNRKFNVTICCFVSFGVLHDNFFILDQLCSMELITMQKQNVEEKLAPKTSGILGFINHYTNWVFFGFHRSVFFFFRICKTIKKKAQCVDEEIFSVPGRWKQSDNYRNI